MNTTDYNDQRIFHNQLLRERLDRIVALEIELKETRQVLELYRNTYSLDAYVKTHNGFAAREYLRAHEA